MRRLLLAILAVPLAMGAAARAQEETGAATLRILDKVTARVATMEAAHDRPVSFGTLRIMVHACRKAPPEETPESAAFLEIDEARPGHPVTPLFRGWMFASSPGLNALEHPIYDVWVIDCKTVSGSGSAPRP